MVLDRSFNLFIAQIVVPLPCFFPSVSSVKTNLMPVDYVELLDSAFHPLFLVSAFDIAKCPQDQYLRLNAALRRSQKHGAIILIDSGNYEKFWKNELSWTRECFHLVMRTNKHHLCFCYDNQEPPDTVKAISEDVVSSVLRDQEHSVGTVVPIVHGPADLLPTVVKNIAERLYPALLAVPERALGNGIIERIRTVRRLRQTINELGFYCPIHLLGTGNPLSIAAYAMAGADSFDGLEWCQTVVDHENGRLFHLQQWDLIKEQTSWGENGVLPYIQSALLHNLEFYRTFMLDLRESLMNSTEEAFLQRYAPSKQALLLLKAIKDGE